MAFDNLKKNAGSSLATLQQKVNESKGGAKDPRVWKIPYDAEKNGTALIRLLPWGDNVRTPWVEWAEFSFQGKGGRYWNRSLKSIGKDDPVEALNQAQWTLARESGEDSDRGNGKWKGPESTAVKSRGSKMVYMCNIFILEDNMHPENVGQVKLFKYGGQIHKKIQNMLSPEYKDQSPVQVFDFWEGANLRIRAKGKQLGRDTVPTYEDSAFGTVEVLHNNTDVLRDIYDRMFDLTEFEADTAYKSYDDLHKDMCKAIGAREVARIMGEEFNPAAAEGAGHNPFPQTGGDAQQNDPFAKSTQNQQQAPQQQAQQQAPSDDPFANVGGAQSNDPFAQAAQSGGNDPFASTGNQAQQQAEPQQQQANDPFASTGQAQQQAEPQQQQQANDPFAKAEGTQQAPADDPFANIPV
ncbi:single-stranded DNA binding protein [Vibrio phage henriette 12B8]|uniref:single-stranded DNA binding protein n=1 Tax=Vibrio phage henriette 12B8 TaxID=573174 RepID=UPI0002C0A529|nr:single-stranded DNA binding protein [Vibrio phage henriette 12B8]AGG58194.1 single-stranded DNA binding protein [Vibrio phage henriette 12B8]